MKNFLLTAVIAASAAMPVMAGTALPYSETFDTAADFATMTVVDANSDNKTWYHSDYYKSAMIDYSDDSTIKDFRTINRCSCHCQLSTHSSDSLPRMPVCEVTMKGRNISAQNNVLQKSTGITAFSRKEYFFATS